MTDAAASKPQDPPQSSSTSGPLGRDSSDDADASSKPATTTQAQKVDKITALQDGIDGLSLSMFEALRRLRDAVAPESGNLGGNQNENKDDAGSQQQQSSSSSSSDQPDFEEFWQNYESGDSATVALVHKVNGGKPPAKREDYGRIHLLVEMEKDRELVRELATTILEKSAEIDQRVSDLPGMQRTKDQQMKQIETLIDSNRQVAEELEAAYQTAEERRDKVRKFVKDNTCSALGILEDSEQQ